MRPLDLIRTPVAEPLAGEDDFALAHAPVDAAIDLRGHALHTAVVAVDREVEVLRLALLALEPHELARVLGVRRKGRCKIELC